MVFGVGFYSFTIGNLSSFITSIDAKSAQFRAKMHAIEEFSRKHNLPKDLEIRMKSFRSTQNEVSEQDQKDLFKELPSSLKAEVIHHIHEDLVKSKKEGTKSNIKIDTNSFLFKEFDFNKLVDLYPEEGKKVRKSKEKSKKGDQKGGKKGKNAKGKKSKRNHSGKNVPRHKDDGNSDDEGSRLSGDMNDMDKELLSLDCKRSSRRSNSKSPLRRKTIRHSSKNLEKHKNEGQTKEDGKEIAEAKPITAKPNISSNKSVSSNSNSLIDIKQMNKLADNSSINPLSKKTSGK